MSINQIKDSIYWMTLFLQPIAFSNKRKEFLFLKKKEKEIIRPI